MGGEEGEVEEVDVAVRFEVAGESLNAEHYIRYLNEKYHEVYGLGE